MLGNTDNQTYWMEIMSADHSETKWEASVSANSSSYLNSSVEPGIYDIFVAWDNDGNGTPDTYVWTSEGGAGYSISNDGQQLFISWSGLNFSQYQISFTDKFAISPFPLPGVVWLLGSGLLGVGIIKKKLGRN